MRYKISLFLICLLLIGSSTSMMPSLAQDIVTPFGELEVITPENAHRIEQLALLGKGRINDLAWSADGNTLAVATSLGVLLYDNNDLFAPPRQMEGIGWTSDIVFHPREPWLAIISNNHIALWNIDTNEEIVNIETKYSLGKLTFNDDGTLLAAGTSFRPPGTEGILLYVDVWNISDISQPQVAFHYGGWHWLGSLIFVDEQLLVVSYEQLDAVDIHSGEVVFSDNRGYGSYGHSAAISPDRQEIAFAVGTLGLTGRTLESIWQKDRSTQINYFQEEGYVEEVAYSTNGQYVMATNYDQTQEHNRIIQVWDSETADLIATISDLQQPLGASSNIAPHPYHDFMVFRNGNMLNLIYYDDWETQVIIDSGFTENITHIALSSDGGQIAVNSWAFWVQLWNLETQTTLDSTINRGAGPSFYHPDGRLIVIGDAVQVWDTVNSSLLAQFDHTHLADFDLSSDGHWLATSDWNYPVRLWNLDTYEENVVFRDYARDQGPRNVEITFSPDSTMLVLSCDAAPHNRDIDDSDHALVLDVATGDIINAIEGCFRDAVFSPDGQRLFTSGIMVNIWGIDDVVNRQTQDEKYRFSFLPPSRQNTNITFSPDSSRIAAGGWGHRDFILADAQSGEIISRIDSGDLLRISDIGVNPDSTLFVVAVHNGVWIVNAQDGELIMTLDGFQGAATQSLFSHDGTFILTGGRDGTVRIWGVPVD